MDGRLEQIGGKVNERLDEGFKKTNETFVSVMARLATIDEAQKKIDGLTTNVVSLQELLGDKRSRGAFGEVQLEGLVRNILSPQAYEMQYTLPNGSRADCVLKLPEPTGMVAVDSKFPLENYHRMFDAASPAEKLVAERQFKADVKKHVDDISSKYIIPDVTSDGAVMFIPGRGGVRRDPRASLRRGGLRHAAPRVDRVADHLDGSAEHGARGDEGRGDAQAGAHHQG